MSRGSSVPCSCLHGSAADANNYGCGACLVPGRMEVRARGMRPLAARFLRGRLCGSLCADGVATQDRVRDVLETSHDAVTVGTATITNCGSGFHCRPPFLLLPHYAEVAGKMAHGW